ncbi:MAG: FadR family transcriptional regulator [Firmicutes bacterium]|nr:FadR family transcriptional regulator [Bacillota bacterium]
MEVSPISIKRIYQSIIEQLVLMIKEGKLKVGDRLPPERTLAEMFNVSRASIREAFSAMEIIGLIEVRQGEGSFITDMNIAPFVNTIAPLFVQNENMETDLLDFRKMLEIEAVKLAARRQALETQLENVKKARAANEQSKIEKDFKMQEADKCPSTDVRLLEIHLENMRKALEGNDINMGAEADIQFHKTIFSLTGNMVLIKAAEFIAYILESSVKFNRAKILKDSSNAKVLYYQHKKIYEAIRDGNPELAAEITNKHLDFVKEAT